MQSEEMCAVLRRWPRDVAVDHRTLARESVEHCREVFAATSVVLAFEEGEEPWLILAVARDSQLSVEDVSATWLFPANRWTGTRQSRHLANLREIELAVGECRFNALPRD